MQNISSAQSLGVEVCPFLKEFDTGLTLLSRFFLPDGPEAEKILAVVRLAKKLQETCSVTGTTPVAEACSDMCAWAASMSNICDGKAMELIVANPNPGPSKPWDYTNMLTKKYQGFASSLQSGAGIQEKIATFKEPDSGAIDLEGFLKELPVFETIWSSLQLKVHEGEPMLLDMGRLQWPSDSQFFWF